MKNRTKPEELARVCGIVFWGFVNVQINLHLRNSPAFGFKSLQKRQNSTMKIDWTPWLNVSLHRRLEVLGVAFLIFCAYFVGSISSVTIIHSLVILF